MQSSKVTVSTIGKLLIVVLLSVEVRLIHHRFSISGFYPALSSTRLLIICPSHANQRGILDDIFHKYANGLGTTVSFKGDATLNLFELIQAFGPLAEMRDLLATCSSLHGSTTTVSISTAVKKPLSGTQPENGKEKRGFTAELHNTTTKPKSPLTLIINVRD